MANVLKDCVTADDMRDVFIPRNNKNDTERYVAVNGENLLVQTGKTVSVPARFAEVIENSQKQDAEADAFIEAFATVS